MSRSDALCRVDNSVTNRTIGDRGEVGEKGRDDACLAGSFGAVEDEVATRRCIRLDLCQHPASWSIGDNHHTHINVERVLICFSRHGNVCSTGASTFSSGKAKGDAMPAADNMLSDACLLIVPVV